MSRSLYGQPKSQALKSFYIKLCANCYHIVKVRNINDHNAQYECKYKTSNSIFIVEEKRVVLSTNANSKRDVEEAAFTTIRNDNLTVDLFISMW